MWINLKKKELTKKRTFTKNIWFDWYDQLINYIPGLRKTVGGVKEQIMSFFKTKDYSQPKLVRTVSGRGRKLRKLKIQNQFEEDKLKQ